MYNKTIVELEENIIQAINNSRLHIGTIALVMDKINTMVKQSFDEQVKKEQAELESNNNENNDMSDMIEIDNSLID